jgi:two-component system, sensor histidine kinase
MVCVSGREALANCLWRAVATTTIISSADRRRRDFRCKTGAPTAWKMRTADPTDGGVAPSATPARTSSATDILLVDDNAANLVAIRAALGEPGVDVICAQSGPQALAVAQQHSFAVMLIDVNMPTMDGFQTARLIREQPGARHTPIIFLTAYPRSDQEMLGGYELGAVDFLHKPILAQVLRAKVSVFVELARRTAEVARQVELLREQQSLLQDRRLEEERRRWEEESLRGQRDEARRTAEALVLKTQELAATIEEKERVEKELINSNRALAAADRRKDEFLAVLGHELRNPLAPLMAGLEILKRGLNATPIDVVRLHRTRQAMGRQLKHLNRLVDDLLDVQRINSGKIELRKETVSLRDVVEQAVATVRPALDDREHTLVLDLPGEPVALVADGVRLTQVIANLLNNAIRYTDPGGQISLAARRESDEVCVQVTDNGRGIAADVLPRIFGMFIQEQEGGGGLGLGLTLVQRLVTLHGGRVQAHSEGPGAGATFTAWVPIGEPGKLTSMAREPSAPVAHAGFNRPLVIALIDDNPDIRETMSELLSSWGHRVEVASDGLAGVELISRCRPDLAIVDIGLPKLDGYGVATEVRRRLGKGQTRLVAVSGYGQEADRKRSMEVGFDAHLVKPVDVDSILHLLALPAPPS